MSKSAKELIQWKLLWKLVSGNHYDTPLEDVDDKLSEVVDELRQGLKQYGKNTTKSDEKLREVVKEAGQEKLLSFCQRLQHFLDIDALQTWSLLCSYLLTEYRGAPNSLPLYTANEESMMQFLQDIWNFYSMERMVVLKIVRNILEFHKSHVHPYADAYEKVLMEIDIKKLRESLLSQLDMLIKEPPPSASSSFGKQLFNKIAQWYERKLKEINEILHLLILVVHFDGISVKEFKQLLDLFKYHSFGRQQQYIRRSSHEELANKINFSEVALFICCVNISSKKDSEEWLLEVQKLDKEILGMHQQPEHGPILLFWMLLNFRLAITRIDEELTRKYTRCGARATQLGVFQYLTQMIREPMFQEMSLLAKIIRTCIYENLGFLCELFDEDGSVGIRPGVFDLLAELLKTPKISGEFCSYEKTAVRSLFNTAIEYFPEDILPLAQLATSLATAGADQYAFARDHLMTLPVYTEAQSQKQFDLRQHTEVDEYILGSDYTPFPDIPYVIPKGTIVVVIDKKDHTLMHFKTPLDFFHVLQHEMNELMRELQEFTVIREKRIERVTAGIRCLVAVLKRIKSPEDISESMVFPTEEVLFLLDRLREVQDPSMELMSCCLDVCTALIPLFPDEILRRVINTNILPTIPNRTLSYVEYARAVSFNSGSLGYYLVNAETTSGKYDFLKAYFRFLKAVSAGDGDVERMFNVELPGLLFLLHAVFPHCHSWKFLEETDKSTVYIFALEHFLRILQDGVSGKIHRRLLVDVTIFSLLNLDCGLTLLRFVGVGNGNLEALVQAETNWMMIANSGLNLIIQLSMTILMHILKQKVTLESDGKSLSPLESVIYTQPKQRDPLRIIPVVTSYMDNIFNRRLPLLACRLLRRFAIEFRMSLLACLDMDADHIRVVFLQRLRDEVERDDVKIAILEFVEACIDCQPGLVEAFFSVSNDRRGLLGIKSSKKLHILTEGIPVYMTEYLNVVHKDPEKIANPLLSRIMSLFHAIWRNNMQSLVGTLVAGDTFWPSLCSPLFTTINPTVKAYSQLFNIMGIEAFKANTAEAMPVKLKECFEKFLKPDSFTKWIEIIFTFDDNDNSGEGDVPEWLCRLQSFKDLMVVLLRRNYPEIPVKCKKVLTRVCFQRLVTKAKAADDFRPVIILAELFLVAMENSLGKFVDNEKEDRELLKNSADLLNCLAISFDDIHVRAREAILGATIEITRALPDDLVDDVETTRSLLCATMDIICTELMDVERKVREKTMDTTNRGFSLILAMHLLRNILMILEKNHIDVWHAWLESYKMAHRLLSAVNGIFHSHEHRKITTELLNLLVVLAKTLRPDYLLHCDVVYYLWLNLLPPRELNQSPQSGQTTGKWHTQDWLPIYARGVELVAVLLQRNTHIFFREAINFVGVHEEFLIASIMLAKESLEAKALALIKTVLDLVYEMAKYHRLWRLEHPQSMMNIMRSIQQLMDHAISLLHRPNQLSQLLTTPLTSIKARSEPNPPVQPHKVLITAMNELIEIITLCAKTLLIFSPKLMDLLCEPEFQPSQWQALIEIQFKTPALNESVRHLSLGALLTAVVTLTKSLKLMQYNFTEYPLNYKDVDRTETSISTSVVDYTQLSTISPRPPFGKSLSTSSYGTPTPSDEILSKLNGRLCVMSLEYCLTLVASQSLLALRDPNLSIVDKQLIRKELMSNELAFFHDFVKKRILLNGRTFSGRKKYGFLNIPGRSHAKPDDDQGGEFPKPSTSKGISQRDSMRVKMVKKLHQQKAQPFVSSTPTKETLSPIAPRFEKNITPIIKLFPLESNPLDKRLCLREEIQFHEGDPPPPTLNIAKLVEEDYLHFLSYLFTSVCHSDV